MLRIICGLLSLLSVCMRVEAKNNSNERSVLSHEAMFEHKKKCRESMCLNSLNLQDPTYDMKRALFSIDCDDTDYIPKVVESGEIVHDGAIPYQLMHNGVKVILNSYYDVQWLTDVIYGLKGHHEPQEERCFYEVLKYMPENATMIELGSYWAYYSLWFASEVKGAKNYLIEPDPRRLEIGRKNFDLNNKTGKFIRGFAGLMIDRDPDINGAPLISIDDFMTQEGIKHLHILHADIQGAEAAMLETTVKHLDNIDYFFISTHDIQTAHIPCLNFFKAHGFIILAEHTVDQSFGGDGLIVAKRRGVAGPEAIQISKR